jgi:predicted Zn-dependent protease with MMP-like domain/predicted Zn-dependent protease
MAKRSEGSSSGPSMDALTAHLDHGWDLLKKNDLSGAENSAKKALALSPDAPEALTLLGVIAAAEGDDEEALEQYRRAMEADPEYPSPMLYAAEILLGPDGDADEALKLIDEALELAEDEDEYLDALLLKAEALIALGDGDDEAREALAELPPVQFPDPGFHVRAARCFFDLGLLDDAEKHFQRAIDDEGEGDADAWHGLGMVREERNDEDGKIEAWKKVRALDLAAPAPPWGVSTDEFEKIAEQALADLPARIKTLLANVPVLASDYPSEDALADGADPRMLGYFSGVPYPEKSNVGGGGHLDCVYLFQKNIERVCQSVDQVHDEIRITVLHETGHFFGMTEEDMERIGLD